MIASVLAHCLSSRKSDEVVQTWFCSKLRSDCLMNRHVLPGEPSVRMKELAVLGSVSVVGLLLRLPCLGASFYGDEGFSLLRDSNTWLTPTDDRFRPVFFTLLFLWKHLGFHGEVGLRSLPLIFGVLQIPVGYALGRRLAGRRFAMVLALLLCVDPILVEFSQELRMYSLVTLVAVLQAWAFVVATARTGEGRPALGPWLGFVLAGIIGVYTHLHYWFLLVGFGLAILRRRGTALRPGVAAMAAIAAAYLPDVPNVIRFAHEGGEQAHLMATDLPSALPKVVVAFLVGFNYPQLPDLGLERAIRPSLLGDNMGLAILAGVPVLVIGVKLARMCASRKPGPAVWLGIELFAVPVAVSFASAAMTGRNFVHPKYMVFSAPFLAAAVAAGFLALGRRTYLVVGVMGAAALLVAYVHFLEPDRYGRREDWRGAAMHLRGAMRADSELWLLGREPAAPCTGRAPTTLWEYYAPDLCSRTLYVMPPAPGAGRGDLFYLWSEVARNFEDPHDTVLAAARAAFAGEERLQLEPRLVLYHWRAAATP